MKYDDLFDLGGKVALVTGSTKGIGRAVAEALAAHGAKVVISSRKEDKCAEVADAIKADGGDALPVACNMSRIDDIRALVDRTLEHYGRIDVLVCNAAVNPYYGPMLEVTEEAYDKIMGTNVKNNLMLCNMVLPQMAERKDGSVILLSSVGAMKGHDKIGIYNISKAADLQLARNLAVEWGGHNIRANAICPAVVKTDMARALWDTPQAQKTAETMYPLGRFGEVEDIAGAAVYLASRAGAWTTGQGIVVDGGATISSASL